MRQASRPRQIRTPITLLLLAAGTGLWWWYFGLKSIDGFHLGVIVVAVMAALVPQLNTAIEKGLHTVNRTLAAREGRTGACVFAGVAGYLLILAARNSDSLFLKINDEHSYMIQARMLAAGRLWMAAYPANIAPFFDALSLITDRVYASMYFPGTALAEVPFVWLRLPFWVMPMLAASISAGLLYCVISRMFNAVQGLIAVCLLTSLQSFSTISLYLLSEMPFLAASLVMLLCWFNFRSRPNWRFSLALGIASGFAGITRPLDAFCLAIPIGIAIIFQLRRELGMLLWTTTVVSLGALPFLVLLIVQDIGVTGRWDEFAETHFTTENYPAPLMGFYHVDLRYIPPGMNAVKQQWLRDWILPSFRTHTFRNALLSWPRGRLRQILLVAVPDPLLRILLPLALLSLWEARRLVLTLALAIFVVFNACYLFLLNHYVIAVLPSIICLLLMGWESIFRAWPGRKRLATFLYVAIFLLSIQGLWHPAIAGTSPDQSPANDLLSHLFKTPAVVLFRFDPRVSTFSDDPVYNDGVAWPDEALVVRARDLGPTKDRDLIHYYAQRQPDRVFYIYDPAERAAGRNPLSPPLGTARELDSNPLF